MFPWVGEITLQWHTLSKYLHTQNVSTPNFQKYLEPLCTFEHESWKIWFLKKFGFYKKYFGSYKKKFVLKKIGS